MVINGVTATTTEFSLGWVLDFYGAGFLRPDLLRVAKSAASEHLIEMTAAKQ